MAPRKEVTSLQDLALQSLGRYLKDVCYDLLQSPDSELSSKLRKLLYGNLSATSHEQLGHVCLMVLDIFYQKVVKKEPTKQEKAKLIVSKLAEVIPNDQLRSLPKNLSEPVSKALLHALDKMPGLKVLDLVSSVELCELEKAILKSCKIFQNLTHFSAIKVSCSDDIITAICENCSELRAVTIRSSNVTNRCIVSLIKCKKLEFVDLHGSKVTEKGLVKLLAETKSATLKSVILAQKTNQVLNHLCNDKSVSRTFTQEYLKLYLQNKDELHAVVKFFPFARDVFLCSNEIPDLSCLIALEKLTRLNLRIFTIKATNHYLVSFLSVRGSYITTLDLNSLTDGFSDKALMDICVLCPNLQELAVHFFAISDDFSAETPSHTPFQKLEVFRAGHVQISFIRTVLRHAQIIKSLSLYRAIATDEFLHSLFEINPLKGLEVLELYPKIERISVEVLKLVIERCERLRCIEYIYPFSRSKKELFECVEQFIKANNYNVVFKDGYKNWKLSL